MAASVRTELMGVTAAAAAAAVAVAVVAASINLPNLHASLPFPPSLSLSLTQPAQFKKTASNRFASSREFAAACNI